MTMKTMMMMMTEVFFLTVPERLKNERTQNSKKERKKDKKGLKERETKVSLFRVSK